MTLAVGLWFAWSVACPGVAAADRVEVTYDLSDSTVYYANQVAGPSDPTGTLVISYEAGPSSSIVDGSAYIKSGHIEQDFALGTGSDLDAGTLSWDFDSDTIPPGVQNGLTLEVEVHWMTHEIKTHCGFWCSAFGGTRSNMYTEVVLVSGTKISAPLLIAVKAVSTGTTMTPSGGTTMTTGVNTLDTLNFPTQIFQSGISVGTGTSTLPMSVSLVGKEISRVLVPTESLPFLSQPFGVVTVASLLLVLGVSMAVRSKLATP